MADVEQCPSCGHEEPMTQFGADPMTDRYYTDLYCPECELSARLYRLEFGPEFFTSMDERGVEPALGGDSTGVETECPGCDEEVLVLDGGSVVEPREEVPSGARPPMDYAFKPHECAGDGSS